VQTWQIVVSVYLVFGIASTIWDTWPIKEWVKEAGEEMEDERVIPEEQFRYVVVFGMLIQLIWQIGTWPYTNVYREIQWRNEHRDAEEK